MSAFAIFFLMLFSSSQADPCPDGYTQAPNGGDCFKAIYYYDWYYGQYRGHSANDAETDCNNAGGGMLASFHSEEENQFALDLGRGCIPPGQDYAPGQMNFGLRCVGLDCKWDDGSAVTFTAFEFLEEPRDDGQTRCYTMAYVDTWYSRLTSCDADKYDGAKECWICKVKAKTFECDANEYEYKGGCVSVHTSPLDQKNAEESCPGGGHLVSIHSGNENDFYKQLALNAGVTGTFYIGGQWSNGVFEWIDDTNQNTFIWANGFPNTIFGACAQMLLNSDLGNQGQWTNVDCSTKLPYICLRIDNNYGPTLYPPTPKADPKCPPVQYYTGSGSIYSPNYPLSIPKQQTCEYIIGEEEGTKASVKFSTFDCPSGTTLSFYDGFNTNEPFLVFTNTPPVLNHSYSVTTNVMKIVFSVADTNPGIGFEAEFHGVAEEQRTTEEIVSTSNAVTSSFGTSTKTETKSSSRATTTTTANIENKLTSLTTTEAEEQRINTSDSSDDPTPTTMPSTTSATGIDLTTSSAQGYGAMWILASVICRNLL